MKLLFTSAAALFLITNHCLASAVDFIDKENKLRCSIFNTKPNYANKVQTGVAFEDKDETLSKHTITINSVLNDQSRVLKSHATDEQRKKILQAVMGSVIIHGNYPEYILADHGLSETDEFYKHFEILRLTQELSVWFRMMKQMDAAMNITRDIKSYNSYDYNNSYKNLYTYSGLNMGILCDWFEEMYAAHRNGITLRRDTPQTEKRKDPRELSQCVQRASQFIDSHMDESLRIISDDSKTMEEQNQAFIQFMMSHKEELRPSSIDASTDKTIQDKRKRTASHIPAKHIDEDSSYTLSAFGQRIPVDIQRQIDTAKEKVALQIAEQKKELARFGIIITALDDEPVIFAPPIVQSKGGNWTETFNLKGGGTAMRTPTTLIIKKGMFQSTGPTASVSNANISGIKINFHLSTDMTRDEFVASLRRDGNL